MECEVNVLGSPVYLCYQGTLADKKFIEAKKESNSSRGKGNNAGYCAICKKEFKEGAKLTLLINNNKLFPNVWVHDDCIEDEELELIFEALTKEYRKFKELTKIWG